MPNANITITTQTFVHPNGAAFTEQRPELHRAYDVDRFERAADSRYVAGLAASEEARADAIIDNSERRRLAPIKDH